MKIIIYQTKTDAIAPEWESSLRSILAEAGRDSLEIEPAFSGLRESLDHWNGNDDLLGILINHEPDTSRTRLLISASNDSKFKNYCVAQLPHADWGCCLGQVIALEYAPDNLRRLATQLHETLHLFGVGECYDTATQNPLGSCNDPDCLMRYGVISTQVCPNVLAQLQS